MKTILPNLLLVLAIAFNTTAQVPKLINLQAAFHNEQGVVVSEQEIEVKVSLISGSTDGTIVYAETHTVTTNSLGIANIPLGSLNTEEAFESIPWSEMIYIKIETKLTGETEFTTIDVSPLLSVPYALYANTNLPAGAELGQVIYHNGEGWISTSRVIIDPNKVELVAQVPRDEEKPIFLIRNSANQVVFAVYESGAVVNIAKEEETKGTRGGFAVGGLSDQNKVDGPTYLYIMPDEVQFNILQPSDGKSTRGGFAVGGLSDQNKSVTSDFFILKPDSIRFNIENLDQQTKGTRGGFAVGGLSDQNKGFVNWLHLNVDTTFINTPTLSVSQNVVAPQTVSIGGQVGTLPLKDIDGNTYKTVQIGDQQWMAENLKTTRYRNGAPISSEPLDTTVGAYGLYPHLSVEGINSDEEMVAAYGRLYNWLAVDNSQGLCPTGWVVPSNNDWLRLLDFLNGDTLAGGSMKSRRTDGTHTHPRWEIPNEKATNYSGFTGFPGGGFQANAPEASYGGIGYQGYWWSSTESSPDLGYFLSLVFNTKQANSDVMLKKHGISVRCIKFDASVPSVSTIAATDINAFSASVSGDATNNGGSPITKLGFVWGTTPSPTIESGEGVAMVQPALGPFEADIFGIDPLTTYYVRAFATNKAGTAHGNEITFTTPEIPNCGTVIDSSGNTYNTVVIGDQCWMRENLKTTKYFDGRDILNNLETWETGGYSLYEAGNEIYGAVYNGWAVYSDSLCPAGWYMPSRTDFETLISHLGGESISGGKLKSTGTVEEDTGLWYAPNTGATNESGFSGLPGGYAWTGEGVGFGNIGYNGYWWTNTIDEFGGTKGSKSSGEIFTLELDYTGTQAYIGFMWQDNALPVRCIWGEGKPRLGKTTINDILINIVSVSASIINDGGDPESPITSRGFVVSTSPEPTVETNLFIFSEPIAGTGIFSNTFTGLTKNTLYYVRAFATNANGTGYGEESLVKTYNETASDLDGNVYYTTLIGDQHWMAEDLRTQTYNTGTTIPYLSVAEDWINTTEGATVSYGDVGKSQQGLLYNWFAVTDSLCPIGWRVPHDMDWTVLENYLGNNLGAKLMSTDTAFWYSPNPATNESGFTAIGTGFRSTDGFYYNQRSDAFWWTSTEDVQSPGFAINRTLYYNNADFYKSLANYNTGHAVRCIEDDGKPALTTSFITDLTLNSASSGGDVYYSGASPVSAKGVVWDISPNPTIETNLGSSMDGVQDGIFDSFITGLDPNTTYYARAYATNDMGTSYGNEVVFKTYHSILTDINTNNYFTIEIGSQLWMAQNLKTTSFSNGDPIPVVSPLNSFDLASPAYTYYDYNSVWITDSATMVDTYGLLYNGYVATDARNVCPTGWHVPTQSEIQGLITSLGGLEIAGGKLKSTVTEPNDHPRWNSPNSGATNESGFTGIPSGYRDYWWGFYSLGSSALYWSSTMESSDYYYLVELNTWDTSLSNYSMQIKNGLSIRCVKD